MMGVRKTGIPFDKSIKDAGFLFKANYVVNGLNKDIANKEYFDSAKKLDKQFEYLELGDYLYNHKEDKVKVYLYVECLIGRRGYNGFKVCNLYVEAKWMDLDTKTYHKTTSRMSQGEYEKFINMLNVTYLEN